MAVKIAPNGVCRRSTLPKNCFVNVTNGFFEKKNDFNLLTASTFYVAKTAIGTLNRARFANIFKHFEISVNENLVHKSMKILMFLRAPPNFSAAVYISYTKYGTTRLFASLVAFQFGFVFCFGFFPLLLRHSRSACACVCLSYSQSGRCCSVVCSFLGLIFHFLDVRVDVNVLCGI